MKIEQLGRHILVEFYNCQKDIMDNHDLIEEYMKEAARVSGATIVESVFHTFNPWGVSGAVIIQESHLTIHTWPEYRYAAVDLFTCGESVDPWKAFDYLKDKFQSDKTETSEVVRGETGRIRHFSDEKYENITFKPMEQKKDLHL